MLGLGSFPKEDLQASSAKLVYSQPLRAPEDFPQAAGSSWSAEGYRVRPGTRLRPFSPCRHLTTTPVLYLPKDLLSARYVFILHDSYQTPLQPPYDGPFRVLEAEQLLEQQVEVFKVEVVLRIFHAKTRLLEPHNMF